jgi:dephospho-CoA kinase
VFCVGLTGSIASGKSEVAKAFAKRQVDILDTDKIAKTLTLSNQPAYQAIIEHFGKKIVLENGELDRRQLRFCIVQNEKERLWLENLLHPLIRQIVEQQIQQSQGLYCMVEIPILYSREEYPYLNKILYVHTSDKLAIKRLIIRDNCSKTEAQAILSLQKKTWRWEKMADDRIENEDSLAQLEKDVEKLHQKYLLLS